MIDPLINNIIIYFIGFFTGVVLCFNYVLGKIQKKGKTFEIPEKKYFFKGEWMRNNFMKVKERAEQSEVEIKEKYKNIQVHPKSKNFLAMVVLALIILIFLFVRFTPVTMNWKVYLISFFIGYGVILFAFSTGKRTKREKNSNR